MGENEKVIGKVGIISTDDTITFRDYCGNYKELCAIVASSDGENDRIEICGDIDVPKVDNEGVSMQSGIMFCNEEFLLVDDENFNKANALASLLAGQLIYGNVALVVDDGEGGDFGFNDAEAKLITRSVAHLCEQYKEKIERIHSDCDNNKPEPECTVVSYASENV